jgi:HEAT repeat protein
MNNNTLSRIAMLGLLLPVLSGCESTPEQRKAGALVAELKQQPLPRSGVAIKDDLVSLGEAAAPEVIRLLKSSRPDLRTGAALVLGEIQSRAGLAPLSRALERETDPDSSTFMIQAICSILSINNNISAQQAIATARESLTNQSTGPRGARGP